MISLNHSNEGASNWNHEWFDNFENMHKSSGSKSSIELSFCDDDCLKVLKIQTQREQRFNEKSMLTLVHDGAIWVM